MIFEIFKLYYQLFNFVKVRIISVKDNPVDKKPITISSILEELPSSSRLEVEKLLHIKMLGEVLETVKKLENN